MTPTADTATPALTGAALDTFLNRLDADLEEAESGEAIQLAERLRAQPLQPDSIEAIERLYRLWINADDVAAAFAVLDLDGARVRDAAAPDVRADVRMRIELCRLRIGQFRQDEALSCRAIAALRTIVGEEPQLDPVRYRQLRLYESVEGSQPGAALELAELQYALAQVSHDRGTFRAWDAADRERRRAHALRRLGRADE
ncbi:hypothetical protein, partial [Burkholderia sp. Ac-20379]|uniref:hypothetical protein n=1 Tax=Burkholderia sp. Ac-20379 TaxID=2703900 RepID=UPI001980F70F